MTATSEAAAVPHPISDGPVSTPELDGVERLLRLLEVELKLVSGETRGRETGPTVQDDPRYPSVLRARLIACCGRLPRAGEVDGELIRGLELMLVDASDSDLIDFVSFVPVHPEWLESHKRISRKR